MKHYLPIFSLILSLSLPAHGQLPAEDGIPPPAPDFRSSDSFDASNSGPTALERDRRPILPTSPSILPPELKQRPPLAPSSPSVNFTEQTRVSISSHKAPLSWRAKAHRLKQSSSAQQRILRSTYDAAIVTLIGALPKFGLRVEILNSKAGELLALPIDAKISQKYIFVLCEMPPGAVTVKGSAWAPSKASNALIETILQSIEQPALIKGDR